MTLEPSQVGEAILAACKIELRALKPGNVHRFAAGHGMTVADFEASAEAVAEVYARPSPRVGHRILASVEATFKAVGCNTNLGIILLTAPLAEAALRKDRTGPRDRLKQVLQALDRTDAELAFQAIRLAQPAGLGRSARHDVAEPASATLLEAMAIARDRDLIARQYATGYPEIFDFALPRLTAALERWRSDDWAAASLYLDFLGRFPDSHVVRKYGSETADKLQRRAAPLAERLQKMENPAALQDELLAFDTDLKSEGINPGTSADLTVASLFAFRLNASLRGEP